MTKERKSGGLKAKSARIQGVNPSTGLVKEFSGDANVNTPVGDIPR